MAQRMAFWIGVLVPMLTVAYLAVAVGAVAAGVDHHFGGIEWRQVTVVTALLLSMAGAAFLLSRRRS